MKSWNLNFLEPPGPLQACKGTALPYYFVWKCHIYLRSCDLRPISSRTQRGRKTRFGCTEDMLFSEGMPTYLRNVIFIMEVNAISRV